MARNNRWLETIFSKCKYLMLVVVITCWVEKHAFLQQEPSYVLRLSVTFFYSCKGICSAASFNSMQDFQNASFSQENKTDFLILAYE